MSAAEGDSILAKTARGAGWMIAFRIANRVLGLASTLILVRLLAPEDFGLVTLAFSFYSAIEICMATGMETQLVRATHPDRTLYDTAFTLNLLRAVLLALVVAGLAAPLASWFREPRLEAVILLLALLALSGGLTNIATVDFMRNMDFRRNFLLQMGPRLLQAVAGIVLASCYAATGRCSRDPRRPDQRHRHGLRHRPYRPRLTVAAWRCLVSISFWTWVLGVTMMLRDRLDNIIVGRVLGTTQVGIYTVSVEIASLPLSELVGPISQACAPGFAASIRNGTEAEAGQSFLRIMGITALLALPMSSASRWSRAPSWHWRSGRHGARRGSCSARSASPISQSPSAWSAARC